MHKFSTAAAPPSSERSEEIIRRAAPPALLDPQAGHAPCQVAASAAS